MQLPLCSFQRFGSLSVLLLSAMGTGCIDQGVRGPVGHQAPDFTLPLLNEDYFWGERRFLKTDSLRGKYVLLTFWWTGCPPCIKEYPLLASLHHSYGDKGLVVAGITAEPPAQALEWLRKQDQTYPALIDRDRGVHDLYSIIGPPTTFLIGPQGRILHAVLGYSEEKGDTLRRRVEEALEGEESAGSNTNS